MTGQSSRLEDLLDSAVSGYWGEDNATGKSRRLCRVVRNGDVGKDGRIDCESLPLRWFTDAELAKAKVSNGDSVLVSSGAYTGNVGRLSVAGADTLPVIASNFVRRLRAREGVRPDWLFQLMRSGDIQVQVPTYVGGSAMPNLHPDFYKGCRVPDLLDEDDQDVVIRVLQVTDCVIEQTEALVAKQQRIKTGLMHDLLTRGLDAQGRLRDPSTHQFNPSRLGPIPDGWQVESLEQLLAKVPNAMRSGPFGSALLKSELVENGSPLLGIDNVFVEQFVTNYSRFVDDAKFEELKRYAVRPLDVMVTIMGTVGRCCVVPEDVGKALSSKHTWTISLDLERYSPHVACWQINHAEWILRQLRRDEQGGVMSSIQSATLRSLLFPVPRPEELQQIERFYLAQNRRIGEIAALLPKLQRLKSGLMHDLLSGLVSVTHLLSKTRLVTQS